MTINYKEGNLTVFRNWTHRNIKQNPWYSHINYKCWFYIYICYIMKSQFRKILCWWRSSSFMLASYQNWHLIYLFIIELYIYIHLKTHFNSKSILDVTTKGTKIDSYIKLSLDIREKDHVLWLTIMLSNTLLTLVHTPHAIHH